ncbi:MAG: pyridoxal-phosphate dependent enzyme [Planctomycetes bacterium]|nr:pyridoxal-phosphate dependent enzyme [Planctomycetota bacterium]
MEPTTAQILAAAERLRGHVVATPLVGCRVQDPDGEATEVRIKPEILQPGGTLLFRGLANHLLGGFRAYRGLILRGGAGIALAALQLGAARRCRLVLVPGSPLDADDAERLRSLGVEVVPVEASAEAAEAAVLRIQTERGFHPAPGVEDPEFCAGIATVGLELGRDLPREAGPVIVAPAGCAAAVGLGLRAAGRKLTVLPADPGATARLLDPLALGLGGLAWSSCGRAALATALRASGADSRVVVLGA